MANEIKVTPYIQVINGNAKIVIQPGTISIDQAAAGFYHAVHNIGTSEESITSFQDVSTEGWCYLRNLDDTNYVQWGPATTSYVGRLEAGETALFRLEPAADLYLKANTAACDVEVFVGED